MNHTRKFLPQFVSANMNCSSCHINAGRTKGPLSLVGIFGQYPQFSDRSNHVIGMRDRIAECFFFSMNGEPPSYYGPDLIAIEAYIAFLSVGARVGPAAVAAGPSRCRPGIRTPGRPSIRHAAWPATAPPARVTRPQGSRRCGVRRRSTIGPG